MSQVIIKDRWLILNRIGEGSFGEVFRAQDVQSGKWVAIKRELIKDGEPQLRHEYEIYEKLKGREGIPRCFWFGQDSPYYIIALELLGPDLKQFKWAMGGRVELDIVVDLGIQIISLLEHVHSCGLVYRDVKPDNFLLGSQFILPGSPSGTDFQGDRARNPFWDQPRDFTKLHIIDFGLTRYYRDPITGHHIPRRHRIKNKTGTALYASLNVHRGDGHSRRDDVESVAYVLIEMLTGELPWAGVSAFSPRQGWAKMKCLKESMALEELCDGLPRAFVDYLKYTRALRYQDTPNYAHLRHLIKSALGDGKGSVLVKMPPQYSSKLAASQRNSTNVAWDTRDIHVEVYDDMRRNSTHDHMLASAYPPFPPTLLPMTYEEWRHETNTPVPTAALREDSWGDPPSLLDTNASGLKNDPAERKRAGDLWLLGNPPKHVSSPVHTQPSPLPLHKPQEQQLWYKQIKGDENDHSSLPALDRSKNRKNGTSSGRPWPPPISGGNRQRNPQSKGNQYWGVGSPDAHCAKGITKQGEDDGDRIISGRSTSEGSVRELQQAANGRWNRAEKKSPRRRNVPTPSVQDTPSADLDPTSDPGYNRLALPILQDTHQQGQSNRILGSFGVQDMLKSRHTPRAQWDIPLNTHENKSERKNKTKKRWNHRQCADKTASPSLDLCESASSRSECKFKNPLTRLQHESRAMGREFSDDLPKSSKPSPLSWQKDHPKWPNRTPRTSADPSSMVPSKQVSLQEAKETGYPRSRNGPPWNQHDKGKHWGHTRQVACYDKIAR
ncbi:uncharacterized protein VTP21DRAFT_11123 [Calcarisporiella thermophila]|uniref:uncharacterized protein n=1 Tax=Calcarisporiella thermophila TaxID=911321 RepID=UPI0037433E07